MPFILYDVNCLKVTKIANCIRIFRVFVINEFHEMAIKILCTQPYDNSGHSIVTAKKQFLTHENSGDPIFLYW